jgi:periplasmic protein CpxP/Spy
MRTELGLNDDQVSRLHKIGIDAEKASIQTRADMQLHRIELRELMRADNPDESAIMAKMDQINALQGKMEKARVQTMLSARSVLTADQLKKLKAMRENRGMGGPGGGRMMRGGQRRPGGPGAPGGSAPKPQEPAVQ